MSISKWCKGGYAPLPFQDVLSYKFTTSDDKNTFGKYDKKVKEIIKENNWWISGVGELGDRPHCRILPNSNGLCFFYDSEKNKCMLGDHRPSRC